MGKVVITGVAGLLGSHLADRFIDEGWDVIGIDNLIGGDASYVHPKVHLYLDDLTDDDIIHKTYWHEADLVIHAAALAHEGLSVFSPSLIVKNNVQATVNAVTAAAKNQVKRFVYLSSMARYGNLGVTFTEDMEPKPQDPYGIAKLSSEKLVANICEVNNIEWTVIVPHNIIGARQKYDDPFRNVASIFTNRMLSGKQPIIYGDGTQQRSFSFVQDVVEPLYQACFMPELNGEVVNVGPDKESTTIHELAVMIAGLLDFDLDPIFMAGRPQEVKRALCSSDKARKLLGYEAKTKVEDGIKELVTWIQEQGPKPFNYYLPLEINNDKTPRSWSDRLM